MPLHIGRSDPAHPTREIQIKERAEKEEARRAEDVEIKAYFKERSSEVSFPSLYILISPEVLKTTTKC